jgi:hypothetical protein
MHTAALASFRMPGYRSGMKKDQVRCPSCDSYKVYSVSGHWAGIALLSVLFIITVVIVPVALILAIATLGKYQCRQCGWQGTKASLSNNKKVYV